MISKYWNEYKQGFKECINDLKSKKTIYKQIPNLLTMSRAVGMIPVNILFFTGNAIPAIVLTGMLLVTDFFDGKIARKYNIQSKFGADLDAICDKLMFLGLSLPLIVSNPLMLINFMMEGIISYVNILGRMKGMDTKTVFVGKVKTWFLSLTLGAGYLVNFFGMPSSILTALIGMTTGTQVLALCDYIRELKIMRDKKKQEENNNHELIEENLEVKEKDSLVDELKREREFLLGMKEPSKVNSKKRVRSKKK